MPIGIVKWYNGKSGYGFITHQNMDIFVHHQQLKVDPSVYRHLVQGEYVQFEIKDLTTGKHTCMAENVTGVDGGPLMCETRHEIKKSRVVVVAQDDTLPV